MSNKSTEQEKLEKLLNNYKKTRKRYVAMMIFYACLASVFIVAACILQHLIFALVSMLVVFVCGVMMTMYIVFMVDTDEIIEDCENLLMEEMK